MINAERLLDKYRKGTCTEEELAMLESWYLELKMNNGPQPEELTAALSRIGEQLPLNHTVKLKKYPNRYQYAIAASLFIAMIYIGNQLYYKQEYKQNPVVKNETLILPGGNKAILTLSNGKQILLSDAGNGTLAQQGNVTISKTAKGQITYQGHHTGQSVAAVSYNTITTPRGGQYHLILNDGTSVLLNAGSSLKYPTTFNKKSREVFLTGEAYFEVEKDKSKPFYVTSHTQKIEVLGTHFNVNAYDDEETVKTTLLEGSVKVSSGSGTKVISPGQQIQVSSLGMVTVNADVSEVLAWKQGLFNFTRADIQTVMRQLSRWYDVKVKYEGAIPNDRITGKVHRDADLSAALKILKYLDIHYTLEDRTITIKP